VTLDFYKRLFAPDAEQKHLVRVGVGVSAGLLLLSMVLACFIGQLGGGLFVYIQSLYAFFAPPFSAIFLLGILFKRINATGATVAVFSGFALGIALKAYVQYVPGHPAWIDPFPNQAILNWLFCTVVCVAVSLMTPPPRADQIDKTLMIDWKSLGVRSELGTHWYNSVVTWWLVFAGLIAALAVVFSGLVF
jgi:SSS family solute:Na+ symporter